jgi:hypothetical protein
VHPGQYADGPQRRIRRRSTRRRRRSTRRRRRRRRRKRRKRKEAQEEEEKEKEKEEDMTKLHHKYAKCNRLYCNVAQEVTFQHGERKLNALCSVT